MGTDAGIRTKHYPLFFEKLNTLDTQTSVYRTVRRWKTIS